MSEFPKEVKPFSPYKRTSMATNSNDPLRPNSSDDEFHDTLSNAPDSPASLWNNGGLHRAEHGSPTKFELPLKRQSLFIGSPVRHMRLLSVDEHSAKFEEGTGAVGNRDAETEADESVIHHEISNAVRSQESDEVVENGVKKMEAGEETEITLTLDDTVGDLSTFSAIANADMTRFTNLRQNSPTKTELNGEWSPGKQLRNSVLGTPGSVQRPLHLVSRRSQDSPEEVDATPRRPYSIDSPTDLLNFTGQSNIVIPPPGSAPRTTRRSPSGRGAFPIRVNPSPTHRSQASVDRERSRGGLSPQKQTFFPASPAEGRRERNGIPDLLDFELEPMATPRSIPTITPRELETVRSELQSQISGLTATLSGKEAEVMALKKAITDTEVRVGNAAEELRNEKAARESLEQEKASWERRGREMEAVLREIRQELMIGEREREKLNKQREEADRRAEDQEVKMLELQTLLESSKRRRSLSPAKDGSVPSAATISAELDDAVKDATERVAKELHTLYKGKHETKVEALKKSYAARWEKQVKELQENLKAAKDEIVKLQTEREATMSGVIPGQAQKLEELAKVKEKVLAEKQILQAQLSGLETQAKTMMAENESLLADLERERAEKGELVAQVDEFLAMDAEIKKAPPAFADEPPAHENHSPSKQGSRISMNSGRPRPMSMLKQPGKSFTGIPTPGESRVGKLPMGRPLPGRGGIMEGIARMGAGGRA